MKQKPPTARGKPHTIRRGFIDIITASSGGACTGRQREPRGVARAHGSLVRTHGPHHLRRVPRTMAMFLQESHVGHCVLR